MMQTWILSRLGFKPSRNCHAHLNIFRIRTRFANSFDIDKISKLFHYRENKEQKWSAETKTKNEKSASFCAFSAANVTFCDFVCSWSHFTWQVRNPPENREN